MVGVGDGSPTGGLKKAEFCWLGPTRSAVIW